MPPALPFPDSAPPSQPTSRGGGLLRIVSPDDLAQFDKQRTEDAAMAQKPLPPPPNLSRLVRERWQQFRNARAAQHDPIGMRLLRAQRMFNGEYDPEKLRAIRQFGGSEVYSRMVAVKARGATSLLRDVYLGPDRPWDIEPQPDPPIPPEIIANIHQLVSTEVATLQQAGQPVMHDQAHMRIVSLMHAAQQAARRNAMLQSGAAADKIDSMLLSGGFYESFAEFLTDLPLFPFACMKGPIVRMSPKLTWVNGQPVVRQVAQMFWQRISPFDVYWTPGASRIEDADVIEHRRLTRTDLNDLLGLPGFDQDAVRGALNDYDYGLRDWLAPEDSPRAMNEGREDPNLNQSHMIDALEYHGNIQGHRLLDEGVDKKLIPDPDRDYAVQTWVVGQYVLKTQLNPNPRNRHPYYITSYEKVPGTVAGHGLPDILEDLQEIANATLRSLVNNLAMASGPQVVVNTEVLSPTENANELYPWKRWKVEVDALANTREPITFFQPDSHAQELLTVYQQVTNIADEVSAIPRYITGSERLGGAGRTASGLGMLMNNASKVMQTVAANIDRDVMEPLLSGLYDMIMLTDTSGMLTGEEQVKVKGVNVAIQKETEHNKQLQFLQITANPMDMQVIGITGRARVLRALADGLGLPDDIVPDDQTLQQQEQAGKQQAMAAAQAQQQGAQDQSGQPGQPGQQGKPEQSGPGNKPGVAQQPSAPKSALPTQGSGGFDAAPPPQNSFRQGAPA